MQGQPLLPWPGNHQHSCRWLYLLRLTFPPQMDDVTAGQGQPSRPTWEAPAQLWVAASPLDHPPSADRQHDYGAGTTLLPPCPGATHTVGDCTSPDPSSYCTQCDGEAAPTLLPGYHLRSCRWLSVPGPAHPPSGWTIGLWGRANPPIMLGPQELQTSKLLKVQSVTEVNPVTLEQVPQGRVGAGRQASLSLSDLGN